MKRWLAGLLIAAMAGGGGWLLCAPACLAGEAGYSARYVLPESGELTVRNTQQNAAWRPCVLTVVCGSSASRTVTVYRVAGELAYPVARQGAEAQAYVYEFEGNYWCDYSNGVKVVVSPACTGTVEVSHE